jgi:hypothetical protein
MAKHQTKRLGLSIALLGLAFSVRVTAQAPGYMSCIGLDPSPRRDL